MKRILSTGSILFSALVAPAGCNGHGSSAAPADAEPAASASASASASAEAPAASASAVASASAAPTPPVHHRGLLGMFFKAALEADLTDDAKAAIDKMEEPLRSDTGARHELAAVHADLVASIKAGKLDMAKLQTDEAAVTKALAAHEADEAGALGQLHDALTPDQRKAVVESVRSAEAARDKPPVERDGGGPEWSTRRLERMKAQLVLDQDQEKQVAAMLARDTPNAKDAQARYEAAKKQVEALIAAFEKDSFDPKKIDLATFPGRKPTDSIDRQVKYMGQLLPILTAGQRDRLALLVEHPRGDRGRMDITEPPDYGGRERMP